MRKRADILKDVQAMSSSGLVYLFVELLLDIRDAIARDNRRRPDGG